MLIYDKFSGGIAPRPILGRGDSTPPRGAHLDCQVLRAPRYLNPALFCMGRWDKGDMPPPRKFLCWKQFRAVTLWLTHFLQNCYTLASTICRLPTRIRHGPSAGIPSQDPLFCPPPNQIPAVDHCVLCIDYTSTTTQSTTTTTTTTTMTTTSTETNQQEQGIGPTPTSMVPVRGDPGTTNMSITEPLAVCP